MVNVTTFYSNNIWLVKTQFDQVFLIGENPIWSSLIKFDPFWTDLIQKNTAAFILFVYVTQRERFDVTVLSLSKYLGTKESQFKNNANSKCKV